MRYRPIVIIVIKSKHLPHFILLIALVNNFGHECDELVELEAARAVLVYALQHFNGLLLRDMYAERFHCLFQLGELNCVRLVPIEKMECRHYLYTLLFREEPLYACHLPKNPLPLINRQVEFIGKTAVDVLVHASERDVVAVLEHVTKNLLIFYLL